MAPHLVRWQEQYAAQGLSVVYVADGRRESLAAARARTATERLPYSVFVDEQSTATRTYGVSAFPTAYIINRSGHVVWEGIPVYDPAAVEEALKSALAPDVWLGGPPRPQ